MNFFKNLFNQCLPKQQNSEYVNTSIAYVEPCQLALNNEHAELSESSQNKDTDARYSGNNELAEKSYDGSPKG